MAFNKVGSLFMRCVSTAHLSSFARRGCSQSWNLTALNTMVSTVRTECATGCWLTCEFVVLPVTLSQSSRSRITQMTFWDREVTPVSTVMLQWLYSQNQRRDWLSVNPLVTGVTCHSYDTIVEFNVDSKAEYTA